MRFLTPTTRMRLILLLYLFTEACSLPANLLYRIDVPEAQTLPQGDDLSSPEVRLKVPVLFFGTRFDSVYVNNNGFLSFQTEIPLWINMEFPLEYPIIAPFYSNVDTRGAGSVIYYETDDPELLSRATENAHGLYLNYGDFQATSLFVVTWKDVGYFHKGDDKLNTYQVAVVTDGVETYVEFLYPDGGIQWIQGTGDESGYPDARAQVGIVTPEGKLHQLPGSGTEQVRNLARLTNTGIDGHFVYKVDKPDIEEPDAIFDKKPNRGEPESCAEAPTYCHINATCIDYDRGFCCKCDPKYYGNGKYCIAKNVPLRVNGKVNGKINGERLDNLALQSYIVMVDGRAYTAVSKIPQSIGYDIQSAQIIGGLVGYLFAKPLRNARNGYQITGGVFEHSASVTFTNTSQTLWVKSKFLGLDVFDHLRLELNLEGQIPTLPNDARVNIDEYQEQYTRTEPGLIENAAQRSFWYAAPNGERITYYYKVQQYFKIKECAFENISVPETWTLKVGKTFISYAAKEQIIRFGLSTKIVPLGGPGERRPQTCLLGVCFCSTGYRIETGTKYCLKEDKETDSESEKIGTTTYNPEVDISRPEVQCFDETHCFCPGGFQYVKGNESCMATGDAPVGTKGKQAKYTCDVLNNCHRNASCAYSDDTHAYHCVCNDGFEGNGYSCEPEYVSCTKYDNCSPHATCTYDDDLGRSRCVCNSGYTGDGYSCTIIDSHFEKPQILSEYEYTVGANENHELFCQGNKPLKWSVPETNMEENGSSWTSFRTHEEKPESPKFKYGLRLFITNMTYHFVGFYYCHYDGTAKEDEDNSASVYLFVHDEKHLAVEPLVSVLAVQYQTAVIPCRPTSKDVEVTLHDEYGNEVTTADYNPKTGFSFFYVDAAQLGYHYCEFTRNDTSITIDFFIDAAVSHLDTPELVDLKKGHTVVGGEIALRCTVTSQNSVTFKWKREGRELDQSRMDIVTSEVMSMQELHMKKATLEDNGLYTCEVSDNQQHTTAATLQVKVLGAEEYYINITEPNDIRYMVADVGEKEVQWVVHVDGHPEVIVRWLKNHNETIQMDSGPKYEASYNATKKTAILKIKTIAMSDFGTYTLDAKNSRTEKSMDFFLNVTDKPAVQMRIPRFFPIGKQVKVICNIAANPAPKIRWALKPCDECSFIPIQGEILDEEGFHFTSETTIVANHSGMIKCFASNLIGKDEEIQPFVVTDVEEGFDLFGYEEDAVVNSTRTIFAEGDRVSFTCGSSYTDYGHIVWQFNGKILSANEKYVIEKSYTEYSNRSTMNILFGKKEDTGKYRCRIENRTDYLERNINIVVTDPVKPVLVQTNMRGGVSETEYPLPYKFICKVYGVPKPKITWYKNDVLFNPPEDRIIATEDMQILYFNKTNVMDEGTYSCSARNRMGGVSTQQVLKFKNIPRYFWLYVVIGCLLVLFAAAMIFIIIKTRRERKLQRELKKIGLANFEKGAVENINPEIGIDDQADLLPYDKKWEFPIERLKLGKQLGSGAFGVVMKGEAKNIVDGEPVTTVAVKMVKKNADNTYIKALASELKVMVHLGKHLNVVNLLGACTKNVVKRELLVIVEYCRYGNLQNYLLRHRDNFINQIDPKTGKIDYTIGQEYDLDRTYSVSSTKSTNCHSPSMKYAALAFTSNSGNSILPPQSEMGDYRSSAGTQMTTLPDDGTIMSNNSIQPEWRSNYKGDYKGNVKPICTKDLLAWSFQVARGMEYLASRKVLHGDLAARNILLSDNNIVKICDFGLAKSMYKSDNYKKQGNCPLPIKWMAIESIRDRIFSTQSDVWSFGIVLWELFSLARTPYPGMEADERLYHKLVEGYRMEAPEYSPIEIYKLMSECWLTHPLSRPSFGKLSETLGNLLEDTLRKHYVDLNDPYLAMNTKMIEESPNDYLAMVSPPTFEAIATPNYQNDMINDQNFEDQGYMSMKPNTIFSPRYDGAGQVFDFNVNNRKSLHNEEGGGHELLPMLHQHQGESDNETPLQSPMAVSNPTYHQLPLAGNIVKTADNYVNMPQNKQIAKKESKKEDTEKPETNYVNSCSRDWEAVV